MNNLSPAALIAELDRFLVNQVDAKRALALAIRNRHRRQLIEPTLGALAQTPHVLLTGPSGVGKTTLVRRAAEIIGAPLVRADVAWLQERDGPGRGAQQLISDLVEIELRRRTRDVPLPSEPADESRGRVRAGRRRRSNDVSTPGKRTTAHSDTLRKRQHTGTATTPSEREREEAAIERVERLGIVLLDDVDHLATRDPGEPADPAGEALQRALIPLLDGTEVVTEFGPVRTTHVLFIATGAFTSARASDLVPEFLGRFPVRADLQSLDADDFERILTDPERSLRDHYVQLLAADGVHIEFAPLALSEIAASAAWLNTHGADLGARQLVHLLEQVLEELSFGETPQSETQIIDVEYVRQAIADRLEDQDLDQFIL